MAGSTPDTLEAECVQMDESHNAWAMGDLLGDVDALQPDLPPPHSSLTSLRPLDGLDVEITQEWHAFNPSLYFPAGRRYFSGDLQFLLSNYSAEAKRKWLALITAA
jgi:hypothetical protein